MNRTTSAYSRTNTEKKLRGLLQFVINRVIKYCGFLSVVKICICFLKLKVYQYYYKFDLINSLLTALFFLNLVYTCADREKCMFQLKEPADENYCIF